MRAGHQNNVQGRLLCLAVYICLGLGVFTSGALEPPPGGMPSFLVLFSIELLSLCATLVAFYLLLAKTFLFGAGLFGELVRKFKGLLIVTAVNFLFTLIVRFYRVVRGIT